MVYKTFLDVGIWDGMRGGHQDVGFSMAQKWKIYRKLNKLRRRLEREEKKKKGDEAVQRYLDKMVTYTLTGERNG